MILRNILPFCLIFFLACTKSKPEIAPSKVVLISPTLNEACTTGTITSDSQSSVTFKWNKSENTSSYEVVIKNMLTGDLISHTTLEPSISIILNQSTPYSWYVVSKSSNLSAKSDVWKFYNSGPGAITYAPFPAEIVKPSMGQLVPYLNGTVRLEWLGSDVDQDIVDFDIYFGSTIPILIKGNHSESFLADVPVSSQKVYYWKVVSKDSKGNTSTSETYQFKVN